MTPIDFEKRLQDYLDGLLAPEDVAEFESWLEGHPAERELLERTRAVKKAAAALPRDVAPARDLWPAIRARLPEAGDRGAAAGPAGGPEGEMSRPHPVPTGGTPQEDRTGAGLDPASKVVPLASHRRVRPSWIGALAGALLAAGVLVTLQLYPGAGDGRAPEGPGARPPAVATGPDRAAPGDGASATPGALPASSALFDPELAAAEAEFQQATEDLLALLESRRHRLPPETLATVEQNLRLVNGAISEIHAALEADPGNPAHGHALAAMYKRRMQLLWIAAELSKET